jgi:putative acyl-CoA dehydrogenase
MTFAAVPALTSTSSVGMEWTNRLSALGYDERDIPVTEKASATLGMSMTEKQGGA